MTPFMADEDPEVRARIVKKLNKRNYFVLKVEPLPDADQYLTGFVREEWTLLEKAKDGTIKLGFIQTPYYGRYGPQVLAKRRPNARYWFISGAYADTLPPSYIDAMDALAVGGSTLKEFDANDLNKIYA